MVDSGRGAAQGGGLGRQQGADIGAAAAGIAAAEGAQGQQDRLPGPDAEVPCVDAVEAVVPCMSGDTNNAVVPGKLDTGAGSKRRCL